ncbi:hypothetical protein ACK1X7_29070 [Streptomyces sp. CY1]
MTEERREGRESLEGRESRESLEGRESLERLGRTSGGYCGRWR